MRCIPVVAVVAAAALIGCESDNQPKMRNDLVVDNRPTEELMPEPAPAVARLTDEDIEAILADTDEPMPQPSPSLSASLARSAPAQPTTPKPGRAYTLRKGDTYWSLAERYLGNGRRWREIAAVNPKLDPRRLPVGKTIRLPAQ